LPAFPDPAPIAVGFPTPDDILITRTDFANLLAYVEGMRAWIEVAAGCLKGHMAFADEVGAFLKGAR
jgi:hypothetical protein